jgi:FAD/FMN-containing dehydrogenase
LLLGGYGYLTGKAGLVIDNLLEVEMVLADGRIVTASDIENPELFWAARGAGASFGVATKFIYQAHEQKGLVWGGILVFPKAQLEGVVAFANTVFNPEQEGKATILLVFGAPPPALKPVIMAGVFFNGEEKAAKEFYKPLLNLGPLADMTSAMPYSEANGLCSSPPFVLVA